MNTLQSKPSQKVPFLILLGVVLVGIPLTIFALQQTQLLRQFAWGTSQSAEAVCADETGAVIKVSFTNTENSKSMDVVVKDVQSGKTVDLGTVKAKETKKGEIVTESQELEDGAVQFDLKWTDGSSGTDKRTATYKGVKDCSPPPSFCPADPTAKGKCKWEPLEDAEGYEVIIVDKATGEEVNKETLPKESSEYAFPMIPDKVYSCKVTPINKCGNGETAESPAKICKLPTPTPTIPEPSPTAPVCPQPPLKNGVCKWEPLEGAEDYKILVRDVDKNEIIKEGTVKAPNNTFPFPANPTTKYECSVTPVNKCGEAPPTKSPPTACVIPSPTPTTTPTPTVTPTVPPVTPTLPPPTPTPIVVIRTPTVVVNQPPVVVQRPPVVVQRPGQVIQQPGPVTYVTSPPQVVQQPGQVIQVTQPPVQVTPMPTMKPTGDFSNSVMLVGASAVLLLAGTLVFFIL